MKTMKIAARYGGKNRSVELEVPDEWLAHFADTDAKGGFTVAGPTTSMHISIQFFDYQKTF